MRALPIIVLAAAVALPLVANADPINPGTLAAGGFYVGGGIPVDLNQSETDFTIVPVPVAPFGDTPTGVTCGNNFVCSTAAPGTNGATVTFSSAPDPSAQVSVSLPGDSYQAEEVDAAVQYFYNVAGGATTGTLTFTLQTNQTGYTIGGRPSADASIYLDGRLIAGCTSATSPDGNNAVVPCTGTSLMATVPVELLASGQIELYLDVDVHETPGQGGTGFAMVDPTLTADNGAVITLSDGFDNGSEPVPEPATLGLLGVALGCLAKLRRGRR